VNGELPFNSEEVKHAARLMGEIWFNEEYVLGGTQAILTTPFGDAATPLVQDPPKALLHRQASFITAFLPEGTNFGEEIDYFYFPPVEEQWGKPALIAGDCFSAMTEKESTQQVMRFLATPESTKAWLQSGGFVAPHKDTPLDWYPTDIDRGYAEILNSADTVRFDASDLMPGQVGTGSFWKGMVNYVSGEDLTNVMQEIDQSWPEEE
jgi:alpha-glucoside transport system substrate-binding protein